MTNPGNSLRTKIKRLPEKAQTNVGTISSVLDSAQVVAAFSRDN